MSDDVPRESAPGLRRNSAVLLASNVFSKIVAATVMIVVAREVEVSAFGQYSLAMSIMLVLGIGQELGTSNVLLRRIGSGEPEEIVLAEVQALKTTLIAATTVPTLVIAWLTTPRLTFVLLAVMVPYLIVNSWLTTLCAAFNATRDFATPALLSVVPTLLSAFASSSVLLLGGGIVLATACMPLGATLNVVLVWLAYRRKDRRVPVPKWTGQRRLLVESWPFFALMAANVLYARVDGFVLAGLRDTAQLAVYAVAVRCLDFIQLVPNVVAAAMLPSSIPLLARSPEELSAWIRRVVDAGVTLLVPMVIVVVCAGSPLIRVLFGEAYKESAPLLSLLALTVMVSMVNSPLTIPFYAGPTTSRLVHVPLIMFAVNLSLNLGVVPVWGASGAATVTVVTEVLGTGMLVVALRRQGAVGALDRVFRVPLVMGAIATATVVLSRVVDVWVVAVMGLATWAVAILLLPTARAEVGGLAKRRSPGVPA